MSSRIFPFTGEDPVSCWAIFSRQSDGRVLLAVTDSVSKMYRRLANENPGDHLRHYCSCETAGGYDRCEPGALRLAELLDAILPSATTADGWLAITGAEAVGYLEAGAAVLGVVLEPLYFPP